MSNTRLTVVVRKDLLLSPGLLAAQVSHAANEFIKDLVCNKATDPVTFNELQHEWLLKPYISVVAVQTAEELDIIENNARGAAGALNLPTFEWVDVIPSPTFEGKTIRAKVAIAIGPADFDDIKLVTGMLPLY